MTNTQWLNDSVLYQIYPQSFHDSNADGVGDLPGITAKLDYLRWLGITAIWINPCYSSPFRDAGYDVADFTAIAPRYGTEADLCRLTAEAHRRGIRVLVDLVMGHTSDQHPWFLEALRDDTDHRYIWSPEQFTRFRPSPGPRQGFYLSNFLPFQPALNFGYARRRPDQAWRQPPDAAGPRRNRQAIREVMTHWLELGVDGFRCDMAYSLVKDDPGRVETGRLWREIRTWLEGAYPHAVLVAEWGEAHLSVPAGFHADFFLPFHGDALRTLWDNGTGTVRDGAEPVTPYLDPAGRGSPAAFLADWQKTQAAINGRGHVILPSSNHDFSRLAAGRDGVAPLKAAFALLLLWPTIPAIYYGDEIGMRFIHELPDVEGSRLGPSNNRAGSRTPMQWDGMANAGFSAAAPENLYLPLDPDPRRPTVAAQQQDRESLLHSVRDLIRLRRDRLQATDEIEILHDDYPLTFLRGQRFLITVNPSARPVRHRVPRGAWSAVLANKVSIDDEDWINVDRYGYGVFTAR